MRRILILLMCFVGGSVALAAPATFVEGALIDGGENARNGSGNGYGLEVVGSFGFGEHWYIGGILGRFDNKNAFDDQDIKNTYLNLNGGRAYDISDSTTLTGELGIWLGNQEQGDTDTDPTAFELKAGVTQSLSDRIDLFGTLSWVNGDTDSGDNSDLRNYIWSLGISYGFGERFALNFKLVDGFNGVNGQDQVLRLGARWSF